MTRTIFVVAKGLLALIPAITFAVFYITESNWGGAAFALLIASLFLVASISELRSPTTKFSGSYFSLAARPAGSFFICAIPIAINSTRGKIYAASFAVIIIAIVIVNSWDNITVWWYTRGEK